MAVLSKAFSDGSLAVCGDAFSVEVGETIGATKFPLVICDPPYGEIVKGQPWDDVAQYERWFEHCVSRSSEFATIAMWGGVGKPGNRPFLAWCSQVETKFPEWEGSMVTWSKKRAYGIPDDYLMTREECFILYRGPRGKTGKPTFNVPLLGDLRGYSGWLEGYDAKSEYKRRTLIWSDVSDMLQHKLHKCQKATRLYEILMETHSNPGDAIYDPCAGSGTTARAAKATDRRFVIVEGVEDYLRKADLI